MDRVIKWGVITTALYYLAACLLTIIFFNVTDLSLVPVPPVERDNVVQWLLFTSGCIAIMLALRLLVIYKERHRNVTFILAAIFLCDGVSAILEVIRGFYRFQDTAFNTLTSNSFFFILCVGTFFTAYFVVEVFYEGSTKPKNEKRLTIIGISLAIFLGFIVKEAFLKAETIEVTLFGVILVVIEMYVYTALTLAAFKQSRRLEDQVAKQGFRLIGVGGFSLILYFICLFVFYIVKTMDEGAGLNVLNWIAQSFLVASMLLLFIGFTKPMKSSTRTTND